jgi:RHS repeat-associated protein
LAKPVVGIIEHIAQKVPKALGHGHHRISQHVHDAADRFDKVESDIADKAKGHGHHGGSGHHDPHVASGTGASAAAKAGAGRNGRDASTAVEDAEASARDGNLRAPGQHGDPSIPGEHKHCLSDPVDTATGDMLLTARDVQLPGALPLELERTHLSSYRHGVWFGPTWASTLDQRLQLDTDGVVFAAADGMRLQFPPPQAGRAVLPVKGPRLRLTWSGLAGDPMQIHDPASGRSLEFHLPRPAPGLDGGVMLRLVGIEDRNGRRIDIAYGPDDAPALISHHGGYRIAVDRHPTLPRISALRLLDTDPPPAQETQSQGHDTAGPARRNAPGARNLGAAQPADSAGSAVGTADAGDDSQAGIVLVRYGYDERGDLVEIASGDGPPASYRYDEAHRITGWTDRTGTDYAYRYDTAGRVVATSGSDNILSSTFAYDDQTRTTTYTDSLGNTSTYRFNAAYRLVSSTDPLGATTVQQWDADNRLLLGFTDPIGRVTRYTHDRAGNITQAGFPDGSTARFTYDPQGRPVEMTDPAGRTWRTAYDERGNPTVSTDPLGARTAYTYDDVGDLVAVTDPLGARHRLVHSPAGLPVAVTDPLGRTTTARRDGFGRIVESTDPLGGTVRFGFALEGQVLWCERSDGRRESWTYDPEGNALTHTDATGRTTASAAGHFGLTTASAQAEGSTYAFSHDTEQRLTAVTNPAGQQWTYTYDPAGRLVSESDFHGRTLSYTYDLAGQLLSRSNSAGTVTFIRDLLGRIVTQSDADDTTVYEYDAAGNVASTANAHAVIVREFDPLDRMLSESVDGRRTTYAYDAAGRTVRRQTPSGVISTWTYDTAGQPQALDFGGTRLDFTFDAAGREITRTAGTHLSLTQTWDTTSRLTTQTLTGHDTSRPLQHREYRYRPDDLLTEISDLTTGIREFALDTAGRVTAVRARGWSEDYAYDTLGNLTHAATPATGHPDTTPTQQAGSYDSDDATRDFHAGRLTRAGRTAYAYDDQGRVVRATTRLLDGRRRIRSYTWNVCDQLVAAVTPDGTTWRYLYDPAGRRIAKQKLTDHGAVAKETRFSWSGAQLAEQTGPGGYTLTWDYAPGTYRPLAQLDHHRAGTDTQPDGRADGQGELEQLGPAARFHAVVTDLVGTPTELVTLDGDVVWRQRTTLWGVTASDPADNVVDCPLRFPGQYADPETGWNFNYSRHYDPSTARYTTPDPLGLDPAPNAETYVTNPYAWIDPLGLASRYRDLPGWTDGEPDDVTWGGRVSYTGTDIHGRPGAVTAEIHKDMLGQNTGPKIKATSIPGWDTAHDLERGHLLAAQLGGSNTIPANFIALHQFSNSPVMRHYENQVAAAVRNGHVVTYTVTPIYRNASDLRPVGVSIHATSPQGFQFSPHSENKKWRREWRKNPDLNTIHIVNSCR